VDHEINEPELPRQSERGGRFPGIPGKRPGLAISKSAAVAGVLLYLLHLGIIQVLSHNIKRLEERVQTLERENSDLSRKLEILNVVDKHQRGFSKAEEAQLVSVIDGESRRFGIDPLLILAVILTESEFRRFQVSEKGAIGLMQIRPFVGRDLALRRGIAWNEQAGLFDPELNVRLGTTYLFELILKFNDLAYALAAYAHGETEMQRQLRLGRPAPRSYSRRVLSRYESLVSEYRLKAPSG
jgi:soluble lytic murein transglycosylase